MVAKRQDHHQPEIVDIGDHRRLVGDDAVQPVNPCKRAVSICAAMAAGLPWRCRA